MSKAYKKAKAKYDEVLNDAGRGDFVCRTNRIATTRHPSIGGCEVVNMVSHTEQQRRGSTGSMTDNIKKWMNRPAY